MSRQLTSRERTLIYGVVLVIILGGAARLIKSYSWDSESWSAQKQRLEILQSDLKRAQELKDTVRAKKELIGRPDARLAEPREVATVITYIEKLSKESDVKFQSYNPTPVNLSAKLPYFDIQLSGTGKYAGTVKFLHNLYYAEYLIQPLNLTLSGAQEVKLDLKVRVYVDPTEKSGKLKSTDSKPGSDDSQGRS